jgi:hypothetical protein
MDAPEQPPERIYGTLKGNRRFFSIDDDQTLRNLKTCFPDLTWPQLSERMPGFSPRQLRERWRNYLSPVLTTRDWTVDEDRELIRLHHQLGPNWGIIGTCMGNRSPPNIKNRFHCLHHRAKRSEEEARSGSSEEGDENPIQEHLLQPPVSDPPRSSKPPPPAHIRRITRQDSNKKESSPQSKTTEFSIKNILAH